MTLVLVVDDSKFMRTVIGNTLQDYGYSVVEASNGVEAISAVKHHDPDVVTMDVQMPKIDGLEATETIMQEHPVPILMLSAHTREGAETTLRALKSGAVDFVSKPGGKETPITAVEFGDDLVNVVEAVSKADTSEVSKQIKTVTPDKKDGTSPTIVIGASTGGPSIVEDILTGLPEEMNARVFVVQHMPEAFTERYAERLNGNCAYTVFEAYDGATVEPGDIVVAKGGKDLAVKRDGDEVTVTTSEATANGTSSIDTTLESVADEMEPPIVAVLLTGMGDDGAAGTEAIRRAGGHVIAQDEETSPVFGIPRRAIQTGNVDEVLSDYQMVRGIVEGVDRSGPNGDTS